MSQTSEMSVGPVVGTPKTNRSESLDCSGIPVDVPLPVLGTMFTNVASFRLTDVGVVVRGSYSTERSYRPTEFEGRALHHDVVPAAGLRREVHRRPARVVEVQIPCDAADDRVGRVGVVLAGSYTITAGVIEARPPDASPSPWRGRSPPR